MTAIFKWEFLRQLSSDSNNTVVAVVRNKESTKERVAAELPGRANIHVVQGDLTDYATLKVKYILSTFGIADGRKCSQLEQSAAAETATITGGGLDYLIANAGFISSFDSYDPIGVL